MLNIADNPRGKRRRRQESDLDEDSGPDDDDPCESIQYTSIAIDLISILQHQWQGSNLCELTSNHVSTD